MGRSTVHYTDTKTNTILKALHNKLRPAGTPVQRVEYIIELLLLRIFEVKLKRDDEFKKLRKLFASESGNEEKLFYHLRAIGSESILPVLNKEFFPFYSNILHEARKVLKGNMSTKVQDQLVLIQDVFANSNFTNNVQSGNLEEIVDLVSQIDEQRIVSTDLLGDAIESALSETGGTKDIGLYRTPDHVRQFMVGILAPTIKDTIFDPACGTGGFLFDSFGYVMESIAPESNWPGEKAHPELQEWFSEYFKKNRASMPSIEESAHFYRAGIYGVEYLGMIRKMAAVNFFVRGLNPHNIEQGDTLAKFNRELQAKEAYSIVVANPPFGAERDQKAYPNVWEEFARESETTILFVKLMLDALAPGGRCAVVVSEGFLIWEQTSARTLRHMLLTEANLQAVIGLPQGVFVSKSGQGPKTSILVFEKGKPTENVWFYNITNDGFTMGTNRTPIDGCQMTEALTLFHKYVKQGRVPPETKDSFFLNIERLSVIDPRIKEKIKKEITEEFEVKKQSAIEKKRKQLDKKLEKAKTTRPGTKTSMFGKDEYEAELEKLELTWNQKVNNEIAKRVDKAHLFSLNSASYRSGVTEQQIEEWKKAVNQHRLDKDNLSLDRKYLLLRQASLKTAINHIANIDPQNTIEADMVREFLSEYEPKVIRKYQALASIDQILNGKRRYRLIKLQQLVKEVSERNVKYEVLPVMLVSKNYGMMPSDDYFANRKTSKVYSDDLSSYKIIRKYQFAYSGIHANEGAIGYLKDHDKALISGIYRVFSIDLGKVEPEYLQLVLRSPHAIRYYNIDTQGAIHRRTNLSFEHFEKFKIPLPSMNEQKRIIEDLNRKRERVKQLSREIKSVRNHIHDISIRLWGS